MEWQKYFFRVCALYKTSSYILRQIVQQIEPFWSKNFYSRVNLNFQLLVDKGGVKPYKIRGYEISFNDAYYNDNSEKDKSYNDDSEKDISFNGNS